MNKKELLKQLKDIKRLMESDIFYLDIDNKDLQYNYSNNKMFEGISKSIQILEKAIDKDGNYYTK